MQTHVCRAGDVVGLLMQFLILSLHASPMLFMLILSHIAVGTEPHAVERTLLMVRIS